MLVDYDDFNASVSQMVKINEVVHRDLDEELLKQSRIYFANDLKRSQWTTLKLLLYIFHTTSKIVIDYHLTIFSCHSYLQFPFYYSCVVFLVHLKPHSLLARNQDLLCVPSFYLLFKRLN